MMHTQLAQLNVNLIQEWLNRFEPGRRPRRAWLGRTGEYIVVEAFPLPDGYVPDEIDILLLIENFPWRPPIGAYVLSAPSNADAVGQLRRRFRAFENTAFHDAPAIERYTWICYHYVNNRWQFCAADPRRGDNLAKFLQSFHAEAM